ncbi:NADH-quinone oxidoreductase subunit C [Ketogulonicigenium robustum]|uniref:NADH-quinone oxidoreductase subunit C n=1 Tax=Ketogulonicigenium robustum TaxID=92947 RepID=A0A1W6P1F4_9RHOB|nr:NADH-quinone oxidoreductase subunit C [Ketogulonicigenium robustum]ARO15231.1 NADH-quinone oxidoreductase subunit C [Ketogulonicigenium robustum]
MQALADHITAAFNVQTQIAYGELTLTAAPADLPALLAFLRDDPQCRFGTLVDITAIDYPARAPRFVLVYHLLSMTKNHRIRIHTPVADGAITPSVIPVYPAADWFEREVFDMFGLLFSGHPDLRRLLTDYGFSGHPLRKDFPTTGYTEVVYDEVEKRVVHTPVSLVQSYRQFDFLSPWEGMDHTLPGDETEHKGEGV